MQILKGAPVAAAIRDEIKKELEGCETKPCLAKGRFRGLYHALRRRFKIPEMGH